MVTKKQTRNDDDTGAEVAQAARHEFKSSMVPSDVCMVEVGRDSYGFPYYCKQPSTASVHQVAGTPAEDVAERVARRVLERDIYEVAAADFNGEVRQIAAIVREELAKGNQQ